MKVERIDPFIIEKNKDMYILTYMIDNTDPYQHNILSEYLVENNCEVTDIYWRSKFDRNYVSNKEPMIYDAYRCVLIAESDSQYKLLNALHLYHKRVDQVLHLENCLKDDTLTWMELENKHNPINVQELADAILFGL